MINRRILPLIFMIISLLGAGCDGGHDGEGLLLPIILPPPGEPLSVSGNITFDFIPTTPSSGLDYSSTVQRPVRGALVEAVFRPTPGRAVNCSRVRGTWPSCFSRRALAQFWIFRALFLKKPVEWMSVSMVFKGAPANASGVANFWKRAGVTLFTCLSVHCADNIVATSNSKGERWDSCVLT